MLTIQDINDVTRNKEVVDIYGTYYKTIAPFIVELESLDGEFPVEILNEVRSIFTHISRCCFTKDFEVYEDNIKKAQRHSKRAVLDCFKYMCLSYYEHFERFEKRYANVDFTTIDNGDFLPALNQKYKLAMELFMAAKKLDLEGNTTSKEEKAEEKLYEAYEKAYNAFNDVYKMIEGSYTKLAKAKRKSTIRDITAIVGAIGTVLGIVVSVIFGIMSL